MISIRDLASSWNRFFFAPVSPLPLSLYRIVFALTLLVDAAAIAPDLTSFFGERGMLSLEGAALVTQGPRVDLLRLLPSGDFSLFALFGVYVIAIVFLLVGLRTRVAAIVVWLCLVSLHHRNGLVLNACDTFLRVTAFWMMFAPAGAALSLDAHRGRGGAKIEPWALRMMQLQLSVLYVFAAWTKLMGEEWVDGTALYWVTRLPDFAGFPVPYLFEHMWTIRLLTWSSVAVEAAVGLLVWVKELRPWVLAAGVLLHLGIEWSMALWLMEWIMIGAYALFLEEQEVRWIVDRVRALAARFSAPMATSPSP